MILKASVLGIRMHCFRLLLNRVSKWVFFAAKKLYCTSDFIFSLSRDLLCKTAFKNRRTFENWLNKREAVTQRFPRICFCFN